MPKINTENITALQTTEIAKYLYKDPITQQPLTPEQIANGLNNILIKLNIKLNISPDKSTININDKTKHLIENLSSADMDRLSKKDLKDMIDIFKTIKERKLPVVWKPEVPKMGYYHRTKNIAFTGISIFHAMADSQVQSAAALAKPTGNVPWNYGSVISTSFVSVILLNMIEPHVPYGPAKSLLRFTKNVVGFPTGILQYGYNYGLSFLEKKLFNQTLPINITDTNLLLDGSSLKDLESLKGPANAALKYAFKKLSED